MSKGKLFRYEAIKAMHIVHENPENSAGKWNDTFGNKSPIILELGCGRGEYSVGLAELHPQNNYLGVDIKGERIYIGASRAENLGLENVHFLRTQIEKIDSYFEKDEIDEVWIPFPDPQLRFSKMKKRLTHPRFLKKYQSFLKQDGSVHLKTDSPDLYHFTKGVIEYFNLSLVEDIDNIYKLEDVKEELKIETYYQKLDIANQQKVHYLNFKIDQVIPEIEEDDFKEFMREHMDSILFENSN